MRRSSRNRTFSRVAALALAILLLSGVSLPAAAAEGAAEGGVISIGSRSELLEFAQSCSLDTWSRGKTVELTADISLEGADFSPIPIFGGVFDGNGHTISGLSISGGCPAGLFGIVQPGGEVRNLRVTGRVAPSGEADTLGGLAGINHGTIAGCSFQGTVSGGARVGGLVGVNETEGQLINCSFTGTATGEHYVGGVAGENFGALVQCVNGGAVNTTELEVEAGMAESVEQLRSTESVPAGTDMGGIAGFSAGVIQSCRNDGDVGYPHTGYNVGGIAGRQTGYLGDCVNTGTVRGRKDVGGIAGQMEPQVTLKYEEDTLSRLWEELDALEALADRALGHLPFQRTHGREDHL